MKPSFLLMILFFFDQEKMEILNKLTLSIIGFAFSVAFAQGNNFSTTFNQLHNTLSVQYALTGWKAIDWDKLYSEFQPRIASAGTSTNPSDNYLITFKRGLT